MALPRYVEALINYDGTSRQVITETTTTTEETENTWTYTVESGDTLWGIADSYYGSGIRYTEIYDANADIIEAAAQDHGFDSSEGGHWIWPGEVFSIPGIGGSEEITTTKNDLKEMNNKLNDIEKTENENTGKIKNIEEQVAKLDNSAKIAALEKRIETLEKKGG